MGIFSSKKQVEELKTALIGAYVFSKLKDEAQIQTIYFRIYTRLHERGCDDPEEKFNTAPGIVQAGLWADAMIELNIPHGVSGFSWTFIPNPFSLAVCSQKVQLKAFSAIRKLGITVKECFPGQPEDNKTFVEEYDGNLVDGIRHEQGTYPCVDGDKYVGEVKYGKRHGQGTMTYASGVRYVGEWKNDEKHGQGTMTRPNGDKYVGEWKNDKRHGHGTSTYGSGNKYVGEWDFDQRHGQGTMTYANGDKYVGEWRYNKRDGQGTMTRANGDGDKYEGEWKEGEIIKKNEDDDEENQVKEDDDNFAPTVG
ncbi:MAG: MORN repeat-containing protein [Candidatus Scalindua sp.]